MKSIKLYKIKASKDVFNQLKAFGITNRAYKLDTIINIIQSRLDYTMITELNLLSYGIYTEDFYFELRPQYGLVDLVKMLNK